MFWRVLYSWLGFSSWGLEKLKFLPNFCMGLVSFDDLHWMLAPCGKKNMY